MHTSEYFMTSFEVFGNVLDVHIFSTKTKTKEKMKKKIVKITLCYLRSNIQTLEIMVILSFV